MWRRSIKVHPLLPPTAEGLTIRSNNSTAPTVPQAATMMNRVFGGRKSRLRQAAASGNLQLVKDLIARGAEIDKPDEDDKTALMFASEYGHLDIAGLLLDRGANVNATMMDDGSTSLIWASRYGHLDIAGLLLDRGANVNAAGTTWNHGWTSLMWASHEGHLEIARLLLDRNANVNAAATDDGTTSLMLASRYGHLDIARLLLGYGANVNAAKTDNITTSLIFASRWGHLDIVSLLCQNGADPNIADLDGKTAIDYTQNKKIKTLLTNGCNGGGDARSVRETAYVPVPQGGASRHRKRRMTKKQKQRSKRKTRK